MGKTRKEGPYIQTSRAKKTPGKTVRTGGTQVLRKKGKEPIAFTKGSLHEMLNVPQKEKIPAKKMQKALKGDYGKTAEKKARFAKNVLTGKKGR